MKQVIVVRTKYPDGNGGTRKLRTGKTITQAAGLTSHLITDSGLTEFDGATTNTAVAVGPHYADRLAPITGDLPLL